MRDPNDLTPNRRRFLRYLAGSPLLLGSGCWEPRASAQGQEPRPDRESAELFGYNRFPRKPISSPEEAAGYLRLPGAGGAQPAAGALRLHGDRSGRRGHPGREPPGPGQRGDPGAPAGGRFGPRHVGGNLRPALDVPHLHRPLWQSEGVSSRRRGCRGPRRTNDGSPPVAFHRDDFSRGRSQRGAGRTGLVPALSDHQLRSDEAARGAGGGRRLPGGGADGGPPYRKQPDQHAAHRPPR